MWTWFILCRQIALAANVRHFWVADSWLWVAAATEKNCFLISNNFLFLLQIPQPQQEVTTHWFNHILMSAQAIHNSPPSVKSSALIFWLTMHWAHSGNFFIAPKAVGPCLTTLYWTSSLHAIFQDDWNDRSHCPLEVTFLSYNLLSRDLVSEWRTFWPERTKFDSKIADYGPWWTTEISRQPNESSYSAFVYISWNMHTEDEAEVSVRREMLVFSMLTKALQFIIKTLWR